MCEVSKDRQFEQMGRQEHGRSQTLGNRNFYCHRRHYIEKSFPILHPFLPKSLSSLRFTLDIIAQNSVGYLWAIGALSGHFENKQ